MSKSQFKKLLRSDEKKDAQQKAYDQVSVSPNDESREHTNIIHGCCTDAPVMRSDDVCRDRHKEIYTDVTVCRFLGIRRRILAEARTASSRGSDWDSIGEEVGMTRSWIERYALANGIVPDFFGGILEKVDGRYVSVRLIGTTPNRCLVQVELESNGTREFARVRNISNYPIHYKDIFTAMRIEMSGSRHLEWTFAPNEVKY